MIHQQILVMKEQEHKLEFMNDIIDSVNFIKANMQNNQLFQEFCEYGKSKYSSELFSSEVRWLSI